MTIRLRASGRVLYLVGAAPARAGDRFAATETRAAASRPGCQVLDLPGGGRAFSCRRGSSPAVVREYRYDPAIHELLP